MIPTRRLRLLAAAGLLMALAAGPPSGARAAELQVQSPSITYDKARHLYTYEDARLTLGELVIFASAMQIEADTGRIRATGFVRLRNRSVYGDAAGLDFHADTHSGTLENVNLYDVKTGYRLKARRVTIQADGTLELEQCSLTTCPATVTGWHLSTSSLELLPSDTAVAYNATLTVGLVPVLWLPVMAWPTTDQRRSGVLAPHIGQQTSSLPRLDLGFRLDVPVFLDLGVSQDLTVSPEWIEKRGTALGLEYNYAFRDGQRGVVRAWGLRESFPRDPAQENVPTGVDPGTLETHPTRYTLDWRHNERFGQDTRLILSYTDSSDGQVRREYQGVTEYRPYRSYQASLTGQTGWGDLAATFERNADFRVESIYARDAAATDEAVRPQLLPRLSYRAAGQPFGGFPLGLGLAATATRFLASEAVSGQVYTASPALSLPLSLGGAFELRPSVTRHFVSYSGLSEYNAGAPDTALPDQSFAQTETRVELRTGLARVFPRDSGPYDALKHRFTPRLIYTELEDVAQPFTDQVLRARPAMRLLTLRLDNSLLAHPRQGEASAARELVQVDLIQRYNLLLEHADYATTGPPLPSPGETEPGQPLLPLILDMRAYGTGYTASLNFHYHHQLSRLTETTLGLNGALSPHTRLGIQYHFNEFTYFTPENQLVPQTNTFGFDGETSFTDNLSLGFNGQLDLRDETPPLDRRLSSGQMFLDYHPLCYRLRLSYQETVGSTVEAGATQYFLDRRVLLTFDITGLVGSGNPAQGLTLGQQL